MTTAIYVRISQDTEGRALGVRRQRADCEALCKRNRWAPVIVYEDNDVSAYSGKKRPAYQQMLDDVNAGGVDRIVAWHPDRLHRSLRELEDFIDLIAASGCSVHTVMAGERDFSTADGQMMARIEGSIGRRESDHKSARVKRKHLELAEAGELSGGGTRPFGYQRIPGPGGKHQLVVDPAEANVVRDMMRRFLAGESARSIAEGLRARGVPTVNKGQWRTNTVQGILTGAVIGGWREHHGQLVAEGVWPPIVPIGDVRNARSIVTLRAGKPGRERSEFLLTGLCRCGQCGGRMHSGVSKGKPIVICASSPNGCRGVAMLRHPLEALIVDAVLAATDTIRLPSTTASTRLAARTAKDAENKLAELANAYADNIITIRQLREASDRIRRRVTAAEGAAAQTSVVDAALRPYTATPGALRKAWPRLPFGQQQAVIRALIDTIVIRKGVKGRKTFDPSRVEIRQRDA